MMKVVSTTQQIHHYDEGENNWQYSVVDVSSLESKYYIFEMGLESILPSLI